MTRENIDYGIDLGTTNSAIARYDGDRLTVFRHHPSNKEVLPSCVYFSKRQIYVGDQAYSKLANQMKIIRSNTFSSFKRTIGTNIKYKSSNTGKSYYSEELSAEVLKQLKAAVKDEIFSSVVISVPAGFDQVQIEDTRKAAELAGFEYFEFVQEPIAASLAFLSEKKNKGNWLVFDLGGGTFDAALVEMKEGIMKVLDHEGDNRLGGNDIDYLILDEIIIPKIKEEYSIETILLEKDKQDELKARFKQLAEQAKIALSEKKSIFIELNDPSYEDEEGNLIDTAVELTREDFNRLIKRPIIDRTIKITKKLLEKNDLNADDLETVLMVGGSTYIPEIRKRVEEEFKKINIKIDPMLAVVKGAALYASTKNIPEKTQKRDLSKIQLILGFPTTTVENEVNLGVKIDKDKTKEEIPDKLFVEISKSDKAWKTGKIELKDFSAVIKIKLAENSTNKYLINLYDEHGNHLNCEPNEFNIRQGIKIANPPLSHDIGISAVSTETNETMMKTIIAKGTPVPATNKGIFICPRNIRPGKSEDFLKIIVWEGKGNTKDMRNRFMGKFNISGDDITSLLPEGQKAEVTIKLNQSRMANVKVYFPYLDETFEQDMDMNEQQRVPLPQKELSIRLGEEMDRIAHLYEEARDAGVDMQDELDEFNEDLSEILNLNKKGIGDEGRSLKVEDRLNEISINLDAIEKELKKPKEDQDINLQVERTEDIVDKFGTQKDRQEFDILKSELDKSKDLATTSKRKKQITENLIDLKYNILFSQPGYWISALKNISENFDTIKWSDETRARNLVEDGKYLLDRVARGEYSEEIERVVIDLWGLMPKEDKEKTKQPRTDIFHY